MIAMKHYWRDEWELTLFARCLVLMMLELLANSVVWIITAILFTRHASDAHVLSLALVAWTTGLRHGLDADHISAIDNATRRIVSVPQVVKTAHGEISRARRPVTVGMFFSLGHSTIVFAVTVAIAVSADVANRLGGVSDVGGIIGASISGSFLVLIGCINSVILWRTWGRLRRARRRDETAAEGHGAAEEVHQDNRKARFTGCMTRVALPLLKMVDRPWKMYPVGVLFGLGFDTASSIALLGVAAIALQNPGQDSQTSGDSKVILLALLFTAGMTMVDSADSCLMIWAYAPEVNGKGRQRFALARSRDNSTVLAQPADTVTNDILSDNTTEKQQHEVYQQRESSPNEESKCNRREMSRVTEATADTRVEKESADEATAIERRDAVVARLDAPASKFSMVLTLLSIVVAFAVGIIVLLGLIGDQCERCSRAADKQEEGEDGGLGGRWWLTWRRANDNSGYVGAGIVGAFAACVAAWLLISWARRRVKKAPRAAGGGS